MLVVYKSGEVCISILHPPEEDKYGYESASERWSPVQTPETILLSVIEVPPRGGDEYVPITKSEPIAFIGANTYVYRGRFEVPLASAISRVHRSAYFLRMNQIDDAIAEAQAMLAQQQEAQEALKNERVDASTGAMFSRELR